MCFNEPYTHTQHNRVIYIFASHIAVFYLCLHSNLGLAQLYVVPIGTVKKARAPNCTDVMQMFYSGPNTYSIVLREAKTPSRVVCASLVYKEESPNRFILMNSIASTIYTYIINATLARAMRRVTRALHMSHTYATDTHKHTHTHAIRANAAPAAVVAWLLHNITLYDMHIRENVCIACAYLWAIYSACVGVRLYMFCTVTHVYVQIYAYICLYVDEWMCCIWTNERTNA